MPSTCDNCRSLFAQRLVIASDFNVAVGTICFSIILSPFIKADTVRVFPIKTAQIMNASVSFLSQYHPTKLFPLFPFPVAPKETHSHPHPQPSLQTFCFPLSPSPIGRG